MLRVEAGFIDFDTFYEPTVTVSGGATQPVVRNRQVRLFSLLQENKELAHDLRPITVELPMWSALATGYETIVGIATGDRRGFKTLVEKGWMTAEDSANFYHTAAYHRHGHPKTPNRADKPMSHNDAIAFINGLLWKLVDEKQPR